MPYFRRIAFNFAENILGGLRGKIHRESSTWLWRVRYEAGGSTRALYAVNNKPYMEVIGLQRRNISSKCARFRGHDKKILLKAGQAR
jgi:hypothetical protein